MTPSPQIPLPFWHKLQRFIPLAVDVLTVGYLQFLYNRLIFPFLIRHFVEKYPSNILIVFGGYVIFLMCVYALLKLELPSVPVPSWRKNVIWFLSFLYPIGLITLLISAVDSRTHPEDFLLRFGHGVGNVINTFGERFLTSHPFISSTCTIILAILSVTAGLALFFAFVILLLSEPKRTIRHGTRRYILTSLFSNLGVNFMVVISTAMMRAYFLPTAGEEDPLNIRQKVFYASLIYFLFMPFMIAPARLLVLMSDPRMLTLLSTLGSMAYFSWKLVS